MRIRLWLSAFALLAVLAAGQARADDRSLVVIFGPTGEKTGELAVHSVAGTLHNWLKIDGASVELRRGSYDVQQLTGNMPPKDLEQVLRDAALGARETGLSRVLNALDTATYGLARRPGKRLLLVVLESPTPEALASVKGGPEAIRSQLSRTIDFCRSNSVNVVVMDPSPPGSAETFAPLQNLATATGGELVRDPKTLDHDVLIVAPIESSAPASAPPAPAAAPTAAAAPSPSGLPVHTRFIRTQSLRTKSAVTDMGPMSGLLMVECPLSALEFQTDDRAGKFSAQARISETVRNAEGKVVWQARKDIAIKEPLKKLRLRRAGNLYLMRELQLPAGQYTIEGTVDDVISGKSGSASEPLHANDSLPGLALSDALFVRKLDESSDRFDADQVLSFNQKEPLTPLLDPVFPADQDFDLQVYFIIYPDLNGGKPEMSLEIMHDGHAVARSTLIFNDEVRFTGDSSTMGAKTEQKHEFPYLATLLKASFEAGKYEARITVRQGRTTVTRVVPFRIAGH